MGRTVSAYFVFCDKHRAETRSAILANTGSEKISVAQVAKALGEKWRTLSDEDKKKYQELAQERTRLQSDEEIQKEIADPNAQVSLIIV